MNEKIEKAEEQKVLSEQQEIAFTLSSRGWEFIEQRLKKMIDTLVDIRTLPDGLTKEQRIDEVDKREAVVSLLQELWNQIKGEKEIVDAKPRMTIKTEEEIYFIKQ